MKTTLIIVRHGETEFNIAERYHGKLDSPLTENGVRQARQAAAALAGAAIDAIYSSPQPRVKATADILKQGRDCPVAYDKRLTEIDCGIWDGMAAGSIRAAYPGELDTWENRPHLHAMPGGETLAQVRSRISAFLGDTIRQHRGQTVLIVSSQIPVMVMMMIFAQEPDALLWQTTPQGNAAINVVEIDDTDNATIVKRGDRGHVVSEYSGNESV